jgi:hypothetical protein
MWQTLYMTMKMYIYAPKQKKAKNIPPPNGGLYPTEVTYQDEQADVRMKQEEEWLWMSYLMNYIERRK